LGFFAGFYYFLSVFSFFVSYMYGIKSVPTNGCSTYGTFNPYSV
jgi:hypothetical protein